MRAEIREQLGIHLSYDDQLRELRDYDWEQRKMDLEAERAREEERQTFAEHPDWTAEQVRDDLLNTLVRRARAQGDAKLGLAAVKVDLAADTQRAEAQWYADAKRADEEKAMERCLAEARAFPEVRALFGAAFAALKKAKSK